MIPQLTALEDTTLLKLGQISLTVGGLVSGAMMIGVALALAWLVTRGIRRLRVRAHRATAALYLLEKLAGYGIVAIGSTLAQTSTVNSTAITPQSLGAPDRASTYLWIGGLGTFNLPSAVAVGNGWFVNIRNNGTGDLVLDPAGVETINGGLTLTLAPGDSAVVARLVAAQIRPWRDRSIAFSTRGSRL